jgi:hypothetical protein
MGGPNLTVHLGLKINHTTINRRVPRRATNRPWNRKGGSVCGVLFLGNKPHWGGAKAWPIGNRAAHFNGSARSHSSNTPQSTSARLGLGGISQGTEKRLRFKDGKSMIFVGGEGSGVAFILLPDG